MTMSAPGRLPVAQAPKPMRSRLSALIRLTGCMTVAALLAACGSTPDSPYYKDDGPGSVDGRRLEQAPDAVPRAEPLHRFANRPYTVFGKRYVPVTDARGFRQRGVASWYGRRFHGNPTSSGETYDMYAMTAAHPTLPIPSYARVTRLATGQSVVVRINDRGPFLHGRVIDLSYAAAHRLGYVNAGKTEVEVVALSPGDPLPVVVRAPAPEPARPAPVSAPPVLMTSSVGLPRPAPAATQALSGHYLQLGAFEERANAERLFQRASAQLGSAGKVLLAFDQGRYRVHAGPWSSADDARRQAGWIGRALSVSPFPVFR